MNTKWMDTLVNIAISLNDTDDAQEEDILTLDLATIRMFVRSDTGYLDYLIQRAQGNTEWCRITLAVFDGIRLGVDDFETRALDADLVNRYRLPMQQLRQWYQQAIAFKIAA